MPKPPARGTSAPNVITPTPAWNPRVAYNDLPPVPREQLNTHAIQTQCELATAALATLENATDEARDRLALFETTALIEAQASSAIEGIITTVDEMLEHFGKARLSNGENPDADDALRHHKAILDGWRRAGAEPIGTAMATRACSTTKGRDMPIRWQSGTVIAGPRGIIYTPPTGDARIHSMLEELWSFMREADTHPLTRMAAGHHQFESIHPFADGNGRTGRLINMLYLAEQKLTSLPILCHSRYILRNQPTYYRRLDSTRRSGDWEPWVLWMLDGVRKTASWIVRNVEQQATLAETAIAEYRGGQRHAKNADDAIRFVCKRIHCRSADLIRARLANDGRTALGILRQIADNGTIRESAGRRPALFTNPGVLKIWTTD